MANLLNFNWNHIYFITFVGNTSFEIVLTRKTFFFFHSKPYFDRNTQSLKSNGKKFDLNSMALQNWSTFP